MGCEIKTYTLEALTTLMETWNQPRFRAKQVYQWLHTHQVQSYDAMKNVPQALRSRLASEFPLTTPTIIDRQESVDGTRKYILQLDDSLLVETVAMPSFTSTKGSLDSSDNPDHSQRLTVCFSTQVGCPMACAFCATGKEGFTRNLTADEMVDQLVLASQDFDTRVSNAVAMGQGEPFLNYDAVLSALRFMNDPQGLQIGARHLTVSTCGIIAGIDRFALEPEQFTLAVSLHSAIQEKRNFLMPQVKNQPLSALKPALIRYNAADNRRVTLEYLLIQGINDQEEDLLAL